MQQTGILQPSNLAQRPINLRPFVSVLQWRLDTIPLKQQRSPQIHLASIASGAERSKQLLSVAPMMDWTDIHYRQLARLISRHTWLYTEMVVDMTILHSPYTDKHLYFPPEQHPIVCQLGGSNPEKLAAAAKIVASYGYDEINLNCGCPSDRVAGAGCFGASLMLQPEAVGDACRAMREATGTEVTVKCRLGVDDVDSYKELCHFIRTVSERSGVRHFVMHARKCLLAGLSPAQNRTIPPLRREWVWALKRDFPHLEFSLNGVVQDCHEAAAAIQHEEAGAQVHGVMIGRAAYHGPWACLSNADMAVFGAEANAAANRREVLARYAEYGDSILGRFGVKDDGHKIPNVRTVIKPLIGLFYGEAGGRRWRNAIDKVLLTKPSTVTEVIQEAMKTIPDHVLDAPPPQLEALPAFLLPEPLPCPHSTSAHAGNGASSGAGTLVPALAADTASNHGKQMPRQQQGIVSLGTSQELADVRETSSVPTIAAEHAVPLCASATEEGTAWALSIREASAVSQHTSEHAATACASAPGEHEIADAKRLRLDSKAASGVSHAIPPGGHEQHGSQQVERRSGIEEGSEHLQQGEVEVVEHLDQFEQADGRHAFLKEGRVLISA